MRLIAYAAGAAALALATSACSQPITPQAPPPQVNPTEFLAGNALEPGVKTLPSGLQYKVVKSGPAGGVKPTLDDRVTVNYAAILPDGTVLDSSYERGQPDTFPLRGLVPAWEQALPMMVPGDEWLLWAPPALAYGAEGKPPRVPPNSVLHFRIELVRVN
jgi:peptidylprolyl isomerase/FKBP-type peptidyl-prolyl cis-trans isomerase FklB